MATDVNTRPLTPEEVAGLTDEQRDAWDGRTQLTTHTVHDAEADTLAYDDVLVGSLAALDSLPEEEKPAIFTFFDRTSMERVAEILGLPAS